MKNFKLLAFTVLFSTVCVFESLAQGGIINPPDRFYNVEEKTNDKQVKSRKPIPYAPVRESDVMWRKRIWRVVDMREKMNHYFLYPTTPANGRKNFMTMIKDAIQEGSIIAYDAEFEDFSLPLQKQEIEKKLQKKEYYKDSIGNDTFKLVPIELSEIIKLRIKEDVFVDKQRGIQETRIVGICPVYEEFDVLTNTYKAPQPLFWLHFASCRNVFAQNDVYNRGNDNERKSWDDIFFKRVYSSYIYKESNVFDRRISEYTSGLDALLESERIKNQIFEKEHDLWSF